MESQSATARSDETLVAMARRLDAQGMQALSELLERHAQSLHRFFTLRLRDPERALDLTQDVFERVIRHRERLPEGQGFRPWLWTIALNVARGDRRRARAAPQELSMETPNRADAFPLRDRLADPAPSPSQRAFTKEEAVHLRRAIGELDEELSSVLHLKYFEEMSCRDVAETLGIPEGTVWSRTYRALEQLRALIDPDLRAGGVPIR